MSDLDTRECVGVSLPDRQFAGRKYSASSRKCRCKKPHSGSQAMSRHLLVFRMNIVQLGTCLDSTADKDDLFHLFFTQDLVWRTHPSRFKNELVPPPSKTICLKGEVGKSWIYIVTYFRISVLNSKFSSQS